MARIQKSTALYTHPFSKAYWRDAAAEMKDTKMIVIAALMIALRVATKGLSVPIAPSLDLFNLASFINALSAMIIGPVLAIPSALVSDFLGVMIWDGGNYFLPYALQEIASSLIWALLLYRQKVTTTRVVIGRFAICLFVNIILGTPIHMLYQLYMYGANNYVLTLPRVFKNLFMFPIESVVMTLFLGVLIPITYRMKLTFDNTSVLKFSKKQIAALVLLFVFGTGCVCGYLVYHYDTTSLTTGYSSEEVVEMNKAVHGIIEEHIDKHVAEVPEGATVAIIEYAKKPFLSGKVTYTVALYGVDEEAAAADPGLSAYWGLKKTPASKNEDLTRLGTATISADKKAEEVFMFTYEPVE